MKAMSQIVSKKQVPEIQRSERESPTDRPGGCSESMEEKMKIEQNGQLDSRRRFLVALAGGALVAPALLTDNLTHAATPALL
ncbi:MAG: hypothetical protein ABJB34_03950 [Acidobacteriota bacterium]